MTVACGITDLTTRQVGEVKTPLVTLLLPRRLLSTLCIYKIIVVKLSVLLQARLQVRQKR